MARADVVRTYERAGVRGATRIEVKSRQKSFEGYKS